MRLQPHRAIITILFFLGIANNLRCTRSSSSNLNLHSFPLHSRVIFYPVQSNAAVGERTSIHHRKPKRMRAGAPDITSIPHPKKIIAGLKKIKIKITDTIVPGSGNYLFPTTKQVEEQLTFLNPATSILAEMAEYKRPDPYSFAGLSRQQGLKNDIIHCILKDNRNQLWIGTSGGVTCYDGHTFLNFDTRSGLCHNEVKTILQDKKGNIWFGTPEGVSKYDGRAFIKYTEDNGLTNRSVTALAEDKAGAVWIGTAGGGVNKYDGTTITHYKKENGLSDDSVNALVCDKSGKIWVGTPSGLSVFDGKKFINYTPNQAIEPNRVKVLMEDDQNRLWFASDSSLSFFDGRNFFSIVMNEEVGSKNFTSLAEDNDHNVWIGSSDGLLKYDGKFITLFGEEEGLSNTNISSLYHAESDIIWIGTNGGGLLKFNPHSFTHLTINEGLKKNFVHAVYEDRKHNLWLGTMHGGVNMLNGHEIKNYSLKQGLPDDDIRGITTDRHGYYWFATSRGVSKYDGKSFDLFSTEDGLADNDVHSIMHDSRGNIWIGTEHGASRIEDRAITNFFCDMVPLAVYYIKEDREGNIWFATSSGIFYYDGHRLSQLGDSAGVLSEPVHHIFEDQKGNLWFASSNGLLQYDSKRIIRLTEKEGLISNEVSAIAEDSTGNLWIGTMFGLSQLSHKAQSTLLSRIRQNHMEAEDAFFTNFDHYDGFLGTSVNYGALTLLENHSMIAGTTEGITIFNPDNNMLETSAPPIQITELKIANHNVDWNLLDGKKDTGIQLAEGVQLHKFHFDSVTRWNHLPQGLSLPSDNNYLNIYFSGAKPDYPQDVVYSYQLEGSNNHARTITQQPFAFYGNLAPHHYIFRVKAGNGNGTWSNEAVFPFTIRPPWWQTWWFRSALLFLFGYGIFFSTRMLFRLRLQKQKSHLEKELALQYERQRISADLHDDIGATLSSINIYSSLAQTEENKQGYLDSIRKNVNEVIEKLDDLVWRINPKYDTMESVMNRLVFYAGPIALAKQIDLHIEMQEEIREIKLDSESKQHVFLTVKELLNNAIKHSNCKNLWLTFSSHLDGMNIIVEDDGTGMNPETSHYQRNGLNNIQERAAKIHADLKIKSTIGKGVFTSLTVPFRSHKSGINH